MICQANGSFEYVATCAHTTSAVALAFWDANFVLQQWVTQKATISSMPDHRWPCLGHPSRSSIFSDPWGGIFVKTSRTRGEFRSIGSEKKENFFAIERWGGPASVNKIACSDWFLWMILIENPYQFAQVLDASIWFPGVFRGRSILPMNEII